MNDTFENECGPTKGTGSWGVQSGDFCHCDSLKTVRDATFYRCVLEIKMMAQVGDGRGPSKGVGRRGWNVGIPSLDGL